MTTPGGGEPRTIDVRLAGPAQEQTFTLPPGVTFDVEAVYVEVDASGAGGPVTAELTIAEQSGVVIARKSQPQTIDAGVTGSATWALRLTDDSAGTSPGGGIQFDTDNVGDWLEIRTTGADANSDGMHFVSSQRVEWLLSKSGSPDGDYIISPDTFLVDTHDGTNKSIHLHGGPIQLEAEGHQLSLTGDSGTVNSVFIQANSGGVQIDSVDSQVRLQTTAGHPIILQNGGQLQVNQVNDAVVIELDQFSVSGAPLFFLNYQGNPILSVDPTFAPPHYRIKTGAAWVANL